MAKRTQHTVVLVEEEPLLRTVLADLIGYQQGYHVVLASSPEDIADEAKDIIAPCITVVGVGNGPDALQRAVRVLAWVKEQWSCSHILVITCSCGRELLAHTLGIGVRGYIQRGTHTSVDLLQALADLSIRGHAIPTEVVVEIARLNEPSADDLLEAELTLMQKKVLDVVCAADDPTWAVVAKRLHKSPKTVDTHCRALFALLNMHDKEDVKAWGRARGYGSGKW